jgi:hypothetical protein
MSELSEKKHLYDLVDSIWDCLNRQQILPCLVLLYSGIEIVAKMGSVPSEGTRAYFVRWVTKYILNKGQFEATALDLYAARCGIVHAFSPDSDLYRDGKARRISYAWGSADSKKLSASIAALSYDLVSVHLNELVHAFNIGVADFLTDLSNLPEERRRAEQVRGSWFTNLEEAVLDDFLRLPEKHSPDV